MATTIQWSATTSMDVLLEVLNERAKQDEKWGQQDHPDILDETPELTDAAYEYFAEVAQNWKRTNDSDETNDWTGIFLEEVFEAIAERNPLRIREELIQAAAVAVAWIEAIDRRDL